MSEIDELQHRLTAALDRIGQGLAPLSAAAPQASGDAQAVEDLTQSLDAAQAARAAMERRMAELSTETERLRKSNEEMRDVLGALRAANEKQLGDAALIDRAMAAELEALRTSQAVSEAEARAILDAMASLLAETPARSETSETEEV